MRIGTAEPDSTFMSQGRALQAVLERRGVQGPIEVLETPIASIANVARLDSGEIDFGFVAANWIGRAKRGAPPFEKAVDLRMVAPMNAGPMFFVARSDAGVSTMRDLRGKRVCVGPTGSGVSQHAHSILEALGISFDQFTPIHLDFAEGSDALARNDVDAQLQRPLPNKVMIDLDDRVDLTVVSYEEEDLQTVLRACPLYRRTMMRKGSLRALQADIAQPAVVNVLVTLARADDDMVRQVAAACFNGADELARIEPLFIGAKDLFEPLRSQGQAALEFDGVGLHDGARAAYRAAGLLR